MYEINVERSTIICEDPAEYGSKGQNWSHEFVKYMAFIVAHPTYKDMPDALKEDGKVQWEAPSNRSTGKYQYTHQKRREWWQEKAKTHGIDITADQWISKTAKLIHPTGEKPCKRCGKIFQIAYVYPTTSLLKKLKKNFDLPFDVSSFDTIMDIIAKVIQIKGKEAVSVFAKILTTTSIKIPNFGTDNESFINWLKVVYIPMESSLLSPGVMSNAPDRFDGFHSFNKCCRSSADSGRNAQNLLSYTTDRRVFEFWTEGDWIAADKMMGFIRSNFREEACADGGTPPPSADHIGPVSLGFCHRPEFRLLSKAANAAKNNRMTLRDVKDLLIAENRGEQVISWYAKMIWHLRKNDIDTDEKALRLSKLLRDNQRNAMVLLSYFWEQKCYLFLIYLMELGHADKKISFTNLRIEDFVTRFDRIVIDEKKSAYSLEQKYRRLKVGFEALSVYKNKENRHLFMVNEAYMQAEASKVITYLQMNYSPFMEVNKEIEAVFLPIVGEISESNARNWIAKMGNLSDTPVFGAAKTMLEAIMSVVGTQLNDLWETDRYVRTNYNL